MSSPKTNEQSGCFLYCDTHFSVHGNTCFSGSLFLGSGLGRTERRCLVMCFMMICLFDLEMTLFTPPPLLSLRFVTDAQMHNHLGCFSSSSGPRKTLALQIKAALLCYTALTFCSPARGHGYRVITELKIVTALYSHEPVVQQRPKKRKTMLMSNFLKKREVVHRCLSN